MVNLIKNLKRSSLWLYSLPMLVFFVFIFITPLGILLFYSFWKFENYEIIREFTFRNYIEVFQNIMYLNVLIRSIVIASACTILTVIIGYLMAYVIALKIKRYKTLFLLITIVPFWTSFVLRVYSLTGILSEKGIINWILMKLNLIEEPLTWLLHGYFSLITGFVFLYLPFSVLTIYSSLEKMDKTFLEAARDLGATPFGSFIRITFPISLPGVMVSILFVFLPILGDYVIPKLLGSPGTTMISNLLVNQFGGAFKWGVGSSLTILLMIFTFLIVGLVMRKIDVEKII